MSKTRTETCAGADWCSAISQDGTPVTVHINGKTALAIARPGRDFICTKDFGHQGNHAACDGEGHILARWPRKAAERYWHAGNCADHGHEDGS